MLGVGVTGIYMGIMHIFFGPMTAANIGWQSSPFQYEVGVANLGFGLLCILAFRASQSFRLAAVTGITCWLWGDAVGHIHQMILAQNRWCLC
jgi:TM2 domain-containing membrane protein YozV